MNLLIIVIGLLADIQGTIYSAFCGRCMYLPCKIKVVLIFKKNKETCKRFESMI
jgi:hypothetical protein